MPLIKTMELEIWRIQSLRKNGVRYYGLFPIQLVLQCFLLASTFISYDWNFDFCQLPSIFATIYAPNEETSSPPHTHSTSTFQPNSTPYEEPKLPVNVIPDGATPSFLQIFVKHQTEDGRPCTKIIMIRNKENLSDLHSSIQKQFPQLRHSDYYLTINNKIVNDQTLLCFQDFAFKTIEVQMRLRGGMIKSDPETQPEPFNEMNRLIQMMDDLKKKLEQSLSYNERLERRIEKMEEEKQDAKELSDHVSDSSKESEELFKTPDRSKAPLFKVNDVQRTPFLHRAKSLSGKPCEINHAHSSTSSPSAELSTTTSTSVSRAEPSSSVSVLPPTTYATNLPKKERGFKPVTTADIKIYQMGTSWEAWYRRFLFTANACSWSDGEKVATLCHFMPDEIKEFLENLAAESFKDCGTLSKILEELFDLHEKTEEEREKEFLNNACKQKETVATFYLRFRNLAASAKENREDKLMKYFANSIRPILLHQKITEKMHKCNSLAEVYQLALLEEKELARLRKLKNEEYDKKKVIRNLKADFNVCKHNYNNNLRIQHGRDKNYCNNNNNNNNINRNNNVKSSNIRNNNANKKQENSTNWLVENHRCAFCTRPTNDSSYPHKYQECKAKYPFYRAKEVRELIQMKKEIPPRTDWPDDTKPTDAAAQNLKGKAGLNH
jgi:hypothetical protein